MPIVIDDIPFRRTRNRAVASGQMSGAPVLVAAAYDDVAATVTLTFDRAIDVSGLAGSAIFVEDGETTHLRLEATGPVTVLSPTSVRLGLQEAGDFDDPGTWLTAGPGNGIVAAGDGTAWAGVVDVELPFG